MHVRRRLRRRSRRQQRLASLPALRLTPYAWAKLLFLRDLGNTEVGGFGVTAAGDLLLVEDVRLVRQLCSWGTVKFDDNAVADFFDTQVDQGRPPDQFGRIWIHTHPGNSPQPSGTDEATFDRCFGSSHWAVMFILARGGQTSARLRLNAGPSGELELPVGVDYQRSFPAADPAGWLAEYRACVQLDERTALRRRTSALRLGVRGAEPNLDPHSGNPPWDDLPLQAYPENDDDWIPKPF
jgi:hypothetical protein